MVVPNIVSFLRWPLWSLTEPEIEKLYDVPFSRSAQEQVVWLDVTMNEVSRVGFVEPDGDLRQHANESRRSEDPVAPEHATQLLAVEELHDKQPRGRRRVTLKSRTRTICSCGSSALISYSRLKRSSDTSSRATSSWSTFTATRLSVCLSMPS